MLNNHRLLRFQYNEEFEYMEEEDFYMGYQYEVLNEDWYMLGRLDLVLILHQNVLQNLFSFVNLYLEYISDLLTLDVKTKRG